MHFRIRKNVVQLVRTTYDEAGKKAKAAVVGRMPLQSPVLTEELRQLLTPAEVAETKAWIGHQHRTLMLREELAALTLPDTLALAARWFARQGDSQEAAAIAANILPEWQELRKLLRDKGLFG